MWFANVRAQDVISEPVSLSKTSLAQVPSDAAFYSASFNLQQSYTEFMQGDFVRRLRNVPFVQTLEDEFLVQWNDPQGQMAMVRGVLQNPNVRNLLELLADMSRKECFMYGGDDWCDMLVEVMDFQNRVTAVIAENPAAAEEFFRNLTRDEIDKIRIPTLVLGFRLTDDANARLQLDALEGIMRIAGGQIPELQAALRNLKRSDFSDGQSLTISLDTSLIPMDQLGERELEIANKVMELLQGRSLSLSLGVKDEVLIIALGEDKSLIETFGDTTNQLLDHERMEILKEASQADLRGIGYQSERWRRSQWQANFGHYFERLSAQFQMALASEADRIEEVDKWKKEIQRDALWMDEQLSEYTNTLGTAVSWSQATSTGSETWVYDWSTSAVLTNGTPIQVLDHLGTNSLMFSGWKTNEFTLLERIVTYALEHAPIHIHRFIAAAERNDEKRQIALQTMEAAWPLVERAVEICRTKIGPALASNETAVVLAAQWVTTSLGPDLPAANRPLPLPELAVACTVDDRNMFIEGCEELYGIFDDVVELVRTVEPDSVPANYKVPRPLVETNAGATSYYYQELEAAVPVSGFKPQVLLADDVVIVGYSDRQVNDMRNKRKLTARPAWMTDATPTAAVGYIDFAGMTTALRPWIEYGLMMTGQSLEEPLTPAPGPIPTGNDVLQIWDCFTALGKAAGTTTVGAQEPTVTRWVWVAQ
jgi:hypothetical protein